MDRAYGFPLPIQLKGKPGVYFLRVSAFFELEQCHCLAGSARAASDLAPTTVIARVRRHLYSLPCIINMGRLSPETITCED